MSSCNERLLSSLGFRYVLGVQIPSQQVAMDVLVYVRVLKSSHEKQKTDKNPNQRPYHLNMKHVGNRIIEAHDASLRTQRLKV